MLTGLRNYIIKITHPRRHDLGQTDFVQYHTLLSEFIPLNSILKKINYGYLYNANVINDSRGVISTGWRIPTNQDFNNLKSYLITNYENINSGNIGNYLKSKKYINTPFGWDYDTTLHPRWNENATNYGLDFFDFNALPGGFLNLTSGVVFSYMGERHYLWSSDRTPGGRNYSLRITSNLGTIPNPQHFDNNFFFSIRCLRNLNTTEQGLHFNNNLPDGTIMDDYVGNDGVRYKTIKLGLQVWVADNLIETEFRNGEVIPELLTTPNWDKETMSGRTPYNNDDTFAIYPRENIDVFEELSMGDLFSLTDLEYGVRLKAFLDHYNEDCFIISLGEEKKELANISLTTTTPEPFELLTTTTPEPTTTMEPTTTTPEPITTVEPITTTTTEEVILKSKIIVYVRIIDENDQIFPENYSMQGNIILVDTTNNHVYNSENITSQEPIWEPGKEEDNLNHANYILDFSGLILSHNNVNVLSEKSFSINQNTPFSIPPYVSGDIITNIVLEDDMTIYILLRVSPD